MEFLHPYLLWGALAVAIPVIIHLWHQKKGQLIEWAATQWLSEKNQQQYRGLRFDNLLLLALRCLMLLLLTLLLAQPLLNWETGKTALKKVHLIQPNQLITNNFRFELEEALKKGEKLYWLNSSTEPVENITELPIQKDFNPLILQSCFNQLGNEITQPVQFELYLLNQQLLATLPVMYVPDKFKLHTVIDSTQKPTPYLTLSDNKKLFINHLSQLTSSNTPDPATQLQPNPVHTGAFLVLLDYQNKAEQQSVEASLNALSEVYGLTMTIDFKQSAGKAYDFVFADNIKANPMNINTLHIISGGQKSNLIQANVVYLNEALTPQTAAMVYSGQLPEWLGELFVKHLKLNPKEPTLSRQQLGSLFQTAKQHKSHEQEWLRQAMILLLLFVILVERWMALNKNA